MGQYFKPINLTKRLWMYSHDYDSGLKQMEHSWFYNPFVFQFYAQLANEWKGDRIVWAGDYADDELIEGYESHFPKDYKYGMTLYALCDIDKEEYGVTPAFDKLKTDFGGDIDEFVQVYPYLVNYTKEEYVYMLDLPNNDGWAVHPLPILTSTTVGGGGGDYRGNNPYRGHWKGDSIGVEKEIPEGFDEIKPDFIER